VLRSSALKFELIGFSEAAHYFGWACSWQSKDSSHWRQRNKPFCPLARMGGIAMAVLSQPRPRINFDSFVLVPGVIPFNTPPIIPIKGGIFKILKLKNFCL
jgi:hypothetical protein